MTTNLDRAGLVSRHVEIESVVLTRILMETQLDPLEMPEELRLTQRFRCTYEVPASQPDRLHVRVELGVDASQPEEVQDGDALVHLRAQYLAVYRLDDPGSYPEDALRHFAELNGTYNVWPYWRELVHTSAARAGLTNMLVPVFRPLIREAATPEQVSPSEPPALPPHANSDERSE